MATESRWYEASVSNQRGNARAILAANMAEAEAIARGLFPGKGRALRVTCGTEGQS